MKSAAVAATAALALGFFAACAPRGVRGGSSTQLEIPRALDSAPSATANTARSPTAIPPATLAVIQPATPLRGANGLACFDRHVAVAEALGDRVVQLSADGSLAAAYLAVRPARARRSGVRRCGRAVRHGGRVGRSVASWPGRKLEHDRARARRRETASRAIAAVGSSSAPACSATHCSRSIPTGDAPPRKIAHDLGCPNAMVADDAGARGPAPASAGKVVRVRIADGASTVLADGLRAPSAVKRAPDGALVVLESATGAIRALGDGSNGPAPAWSSRTSHLVSTASRRAAIRRWSRTSSRERSSLSSHGLRAPGFSIRLVSRAHVVSRKPARICW